MKPLDLKRKSIANALVWAAMMIAGALLLQGSDNAQTMNMLMIAGWFVTNGLVSDDAASAPGYCAARRKN